jgi:hypothetical protein
VSYFQETQDKDKMGLISFATTAKVDFALGINYVSGMKSSIGALCPGNDCVGGTLTEDALDRADGPGGFTDQTGVPGDKRIQQFVVLFSDGMPTALRDRFKYDNTVYDAVVVAGGTRDIHGVLRANCRTGDYPYMSVNSRLVKPDAVITSDVQFNDDTTIRYGNAASTTGDGKSVSSSACGTATTKWYLFEKNPVPGYTAEFCKIPNNSTALIPYFCETARQLALDNAQALKDKGIKVYVVGLGTSTEIDTAYLQSLSSGASYTYITPNSSELEAIFSKIAKEIKLRLVQ